MHDCQLGQGQNEMHWILFALGVLGNRNPKVIGFDESARIN
jgi:hypothetical protein